MGTGAHLAPAKVSGMKICVSFMSIGRCSRSSTCPLKHEMDDKEFEHWKDYFGRTPCRDGAACSCLPQCVYQHPPEHRALRQARLMEQGIVKTHQQALGAQPSHTTPPSATGNSSPVISTQGTAGAW